MRFKKYLAVAGAVSMLASAIPFAASAAEETTGLDFKYSSAEEGKAVITEVTTDEEEFTIPETFKDGDKEFTVVGVSDYAFGLCENLNVINVPDTLDKENTGNVAFLTLSAMMNFLDNELSSTATVDDVIKYVAEKAKYKNGNYTDADLAELSVKLRNKLKDVDISIANTVEGKVMVLLKNVNNLDLSQKNKNNFNLWISLATYNGLTLCGSEGIYMEEYAKAKEILGMKYEVKAAYLRGDADGDGKVNIADAAIIARWVAKKQLPTYAENPAADFNGDKAINIADAAAIARAVAKREL